ncbi:anti-sigma factor domain-containing protein [Tepidibacillus fermentans]|uniref:Anti-sigma factor-like protein n=1 Tax=Tepidibacillus fermentans TaxID=1281767 RepID=A0A4R3K977_9BACI|nr:anti-sigma factor domain-containing protein [Tepidibacillus fermentans]TCS79403.1 anti-sigma factor-like protein [Tepidibacillus fermentans]
MKKSGIVMEILANGKAIVLTKDGEFLSVVPHTRVEIGEETTFTLPREKRFLSLSKRNMRWIRSIAAVFLLLLVGAPGFWNSLSEEVAAYVSLDINPSIDLSVSQSGKVLEVKALNADGQSIIQTIGESIKKRPIDEATAMIFAEAHRQGYLQPKGEVLISVTNIGENQVSEQEMKNRIKQSMAKQENEIKDVSIITLATSTKIREEAQKNGLSTGKYAFYILANNQGYSISLEQIRDHSIYEMIQKEPKLKKMITRTITSEELDREFEYFQQPALKTIDHQEKTEKQPHSSKQTDLQKVQSQPKKSEDKQEGPKGSIINSKQQKEKTNKNENEHQKELINKQIEIKVSTIIDKDEETKPAIQKDHNEVEENEVKHNRDDLDKEDGE